jgi:hypothetical protein
MTLILHTSIVHLSLLCGFDILACINSEFLNVWIFKYITVVMRSKARNIFARSNNGILGLNPTGDTDACVHFFLFFCCSMLPCDGLIPVQGVYQLSVSGIRIKDLQRSIGRIHYMPNTANMTNISIVTTYYQLLSFLGHNPIKPTYKESCFIQTSYKRNQQTAIKINV